MGKLCDVKLKVGDMTQSLMGHDAGRLYVVVAELNDDFVLVADGKYRTTENPKVKRRKHLKFLCETDAHDDLSVKRQITLMEEHYAKRR